MSKKNDPLDTVMMTIELLDHIPRNHYTSAPELHKQMAEAGYQRDLRSIQRQLETLCKHFDIIRDDSSKPYGYKWKERAKGLSIPRLNEQESLLLLLAEQHLEKLLPPSILHSMSDFFYQARKTLSQSVPGNNTHKLAKEWLTKVSVISSSQPLLPPPIAKGVFEAVSKALYHNQWLEIEYENASGERRTSQVMPLGLAQKDQCLYLACRFFGYDNERTLALHRIRSASVSTIHFERPADFDLNEYDRDGRFTFGEGKQVLLSFKVDQETGKHLLESRLSEDQTHKEVGSCYEITATVTHSQRLQWWLNSFGKNVTDVHFEDLVE